VNGYLAGVLVTGSRTFSDVLAIHAALDEAWYDAIQDGWSGIEVIEGQASGADAIAAAWARQHHEHGVGHQPMPADWAACAADCPDGHRREAHGTTYCPTAGHRRNQQMVNAGPLLTLAFLAPCTSPRCTKPRPHDSHGATNCAQLARAAGIPVTEVKPA